MIFLLAVLRGVGPQSLQGNSLRSDCGRGLPQKPRQEGCASDFYGDGKITVNDDGVSGGCASETVAESPYLTDEQIGVNRTA